MKCKYEDKVTAFHDGKLHKLDTDNVQAHLKECKTCQSLLAQLEKKDAFIRQISQVDVDLRNPAQLKSQILSRLPERKTRFQDIVANVSEHILGLVLQPAARYSIISAAVFIVGLFIYQHYMLVEKVDALANRMEVNIQTNVQRSSLMDRLEILSGAQGTGELSDLDRLINDYRILSLRYQVLVKTLKNQYPDNAWRFLTGDIDTIRQLTDAAGYHFQKVGTEFLHPVVFFVVSPDGMIVRYLHGTHVVPKDLTLALYEARAGQVGTTIRKMVQYCFSFDPEQKTYVFNILRVTATAILTTLAIFAAFLVFGGKKPNKKINAAKDENL